MLIILLLCVLLARKAWNLYYKKNWDKNVTVTLQFDTPAVYAGDNTTLLEVIENRKSLPVPVLEVGFHTKRELVFKDTENTNVSDYIYKRDIFSVLGWQKITRQIQVQCTKRGYYKVQEADLTTHALLFEKRYSKNLETNTGIYVYPAQTEISDVLALCERMLGDLQCAKGLYEDPFAFRTIREYTLQDPMKTVNWKASAKIGNLMVNTFDSVLNQKARIYLDVEDSGILKYDNLVEESISVAATLARKLMKRGMDIAFISNAKTEQGDMCILPSSGQKAQLIKLERMLARYRKEDGCGQYEDCFDNPGEDVVHVFITKNLTYELFEKIVDYVGKEQMAIIICPLIKGQAAAFEGMERRNIRLILREVERC